MLVGEWNEFIQTPTRQLSEIRNHGNVYGDCDDAAVLLASLFSSVGIPARFVALKNGASYVHVFVEGFDGGAWVRADPTANGPTFPGLTRMVLEV